jgi:hypothetical protein
MIGLDPRSFALGGLMDGIGRRFVPDIGVTQAGVALAVALLLLTAVVAFVWVRASVRAARAASDPSRRSFLTGIASGAGAALGALVVGGAAGLARTLRGVGNGGRGWSDQANEIFVPAPYTHPEYKSERVEGEPYRGPSAAGAHRLGGLRHRARHGAHQRRGRRAHRADGARAGRQLLRYLARLR